MANFPDSIPTSEIHHRLSRQSLMLEMAAGSALIAVPASAIAAPVLSPRERLAILVNEIKVVALEAYPTIDTWSIAISKEGESEGCPFLVTAFEKRPAKVSKVPVRWRGLDQLDPVQS